MSVDSHFEELSRHETLQLLHEYFPFFNILIRHRSADKKFSHDSEFCISAAAKTSDERGCHISTSAQCKKLLSERSDNAENLGQLIYSAQFIAAKECVNCELR
jgi:hypothetical protein